MALKPFYNKKYHLGMPIEDVKAALQALPAPEAGDAGKAVVVNEDGDGYELGEAGGGKLYCHLLFFNRGSRWTNSVIYNYDPTPFTLATLKTYLQNTGPVIATGVDITYNPNDGAYYYDVPRSLYADNNFVRVESSRFIVNATTPGTVSASATTASVNTLNSDTVHEV